MLEQALGRKNRNTDHFKKMLDYWDKAGKEAVRILFIFDDIQLKQILKPLLSEMKKWREQQYQAYAIITGNFQDTARLQKNMDGYDQIHMRKLPVSSIAERYAHVFQIPLQDAVHIASSTMGYPYAFQLYEEEKWNDQNISEDPLHKKICSRLFSEISEDIWAGLSIKRSQPTRHHRNRRSPSCSPEKIQNSF